MAFGTSAFQAALFATFESPLEKGDPFPWQSVSSFVTTHECHKWDPESRLLLAKYLAEKLLEHPCLDLRLVAGIISMNHEDNVDFMSELCIFPYGPRRANSRTRADFYFADIVGAIRTRNFGILKVVMAYGGVEWFVPAMACDSKNLEFRYYLESLFVMDSRNPSLSLVFKHMRTLTNELNSRRLFPQGKEGAKAIRRLMVLKVLEVLGSRPGSEDEADAVECINYLFEAIEKPFVTIGDVQELICPPKELAPWFDERRFRGDLDRLSRLFPEINVLRPRTLKHLSRCEVRRQLCKRGLLPVVLAGLPLPRKIKDYLLIRRPEF